MEPSEVNNNNEQEDKEEEEAKQCRICRDNDEDNEEMGKLIRPCACKGSLLYVHEVLACTKTIFSLR